MFSPKTSHEFCLNRIHVGAKIIAVFCFCCSNPKEVFASQANQQKVDVKIYPWTKCEISKDGHDWHILADNDRRIKLESNSSVPRPDGGSSMEY